MINGLAKFRPIKMAYSAAFGVLGKMRCVSIGLIAV